MKNRKKFLKKKIPEEKWGVYLYDPNGILSKYELYYDQCASIAAKIRHEKELPTEDIIIRREK